METRVPHFNVFLGLCILFFASHVTQLGQNLFSLVLGSCGAQCSWRWWNPFCSCEANSGKLEFQSVNSKTHQLTLMYNEASEKYYFVLLKIIFKSNATQDGTFNGKLG